MDVKCMIETTKRLMQQLAEKKGKHPDELVPWQDYDPVWLDEEVERICDGGGVRWTGD